MVPFRSTHPAVTAGAAISRGQQTTQMCDSMGGGKPITITSPSNLPGGGVAHSFTLSGVLNQYLVPPASFRPLTASAAPPEPE